MPAAGNTTDSDRQAARAAEAASPLPLTSAVLLTKLSLHLFSKFRDLGHHEPEHEPPRYLERHHTEQLELRHHHRTNLYREFPFLSPPLGSVCFRVVFCCRVCQKASCPSSDCFIWDNERGAAFLQQALPVFWLSCFVFFSGPPPPAKAHRPYLALLHEAAGGGGGGVEDRAVASRGRRSRRASASVRPSVRRPSSIPASLSSSPSPSPSGGHQVFASRSHFSSRQQ